MIQVTPSDQYAYNPIEREPVTPLNGCHCVSERTRL